MTGVALLSLVISGLAGAGHSPAAAKDDRVCDALDHGAARDGRALDTRAIQAAIDACAAAGGGRARLPGPGTYRSGTLLLKNGVSLEIAEGAVLLGSADLADYLTLDPFVDGVGQTRGAALIGAEGARDIAILGPGTIDGQGQLWDESHPDRPRRPFLVRLVRCSDVSIAGVRMVRSPAWTCNLYQSRRVAIDGVTIDSRVNANNDGIDLDGCRQVTIRRVHIRTGDDAICFKTTSLEPNEDVEVTGCELSSRWSAFKWGTESLGDMRRFRISRCLIRDTRGGGFKILSADGARISDIAISDVALENVDMPVSLILKSRLRGYRGLPGRDVGSIENVRIERMAARAPDEGRVTPAAGILVTGLPASPLSGLALSQVYLSLPGGGDLQEAAVPELESEYPEYGRFGVLPAFGAYLRHTRDGLLEGLVLDARAADRRPSLRCDDVPPNTSGKWRVLARAAEQSDWRSVECRTQ